jgi:hypothetical protein
VYVLSQETELFVTTAVRISNPIDIYLLAQVNYSASKFNFPAFKMLCYKMFVYCVMMTEQFKRRCSNGGIAEDRVFFMV